MIAATTLLLMTPLTLLLVLRGRDWTLKGRWMGICAWGIAALVVAPLAMRVGGADSFGWMQSLAWSIFMLGPVLLVGLGSRSGAFPAAGRALPALGVALGCIGIDAFFVEPRWLELSRISMPGLPMKVVLVADIQTDQVGAWEESVFDKIVAEDADLILFAGDYIQAPKAVWSEQAEKLRGQMKRLRPRVAAVAVHGDVDPKAWKSIFEGTQVRAEEETTILNFGSVILTALHIDDSRAPALGRPSPVQKQDTYHIVLGHAPDIALARPPAELIVAGHTHGGQVRLPWIGPLLTFSQVPRAWAAGAHPTPGGALLVVSRGIGMERKEAPRLRFGCRPELVVLEPG